MCAKPRRLRALAATGALLLASMAVTVWLLPHYLGATTGIFHAFVIEAWRRARDAAKVVWARRMDDASDDELIRYFSGRRSSGHARAIHLSRN